jgi:hypothetical protein
LVIGADKPPASSDSFGVQIVPDALEDVSLPAVMPSLGVGITHPSTGVDIPTQRR